MTLDTDSRDRRTEPTPAPRDDKRSWWSSPIGVVTLGFIAVGGYFLLTEHTAHVFGALPWLLLAACPLMHLFMHHGHHNGGHDHGARPDPEVKR